MYKISIFANVGTKDSRLHRGIIPTTITRISTPKLKNFANVCKDIKIWSLRNPIGWFWNASTTNE